MQLLYIQTYLKYNLSRVFEAENINFTNKKTDCKIGLCLYFCHSELDSESINAIFRTPYWIDPESSSG